MTGPTTTDERDATRDPTWVFGYGSLVSPVSLASTIERDVTIGVDFIEAELRGWGRRWNYGVGHVRASFEVGGRFVDDGTIVALGLVRSPGEHVNGIVALVTADELARLDRRERDYDRVDVTAAIAVREHPDLGSRGHRIVTYVPRPGAVQRYQDARDAGRAGIRRTYWELVDDAFAALGPDRRHVFHASTPAPDVPLVDVVPDPGRTVR